MGQSWDENGNPVAPTSWDEHGNPISASQSKPPQPEPTMLTHPLDTLAASGGKFLSGIGHAIMHPIDTGENIAATLAGATGVQGPPGSFQHDVAVPTANKVGKFYASRYGGLSNIGHTLNTDPVGAMADVATVADPAASLLKGGAAVADVANAARAASALRTAADVADKAGTVTNPAALAVKGAGYGLSKLAGAATKVATPRPTRPSARSRISRRCLRQPAATPSFGARPRGPCSPLRRPAA